MACPEHDSLFFLLKSSKSRSVVLEVVKGVFLRWFFYFSAKLDFSEKVVVFRFCVVGRPLRLPSHAFIDIVIFGVVPSFRPCLWSPLLEAF